MDIKLNARLSAYTKIDAIEHNCDTSRVTNEQIDSLFENDLAPDAQEPTSTESARVTRSAIDSLFK